ncbi:MAG TPA: hypothetical protein VGD99_20300 [Anaerolineae bacterium]
MSDEWLDELKELHDKDKAEQQPKRQNLKQPDKLQQAEAIMRQSMAHQLLRQVQKALLSGKGVVEIYDGASQYDRAIALIWQGPISAARKPNPNDSKDYRYILVGVRDGKMWVNGKSLPAATPDALKAALLEASKDPSRGKWVNK